MMRWQLAVLLIIAISSLLASTISPMDPMTTDVANQLHQPDSDHILGTDLLGRDVFSRLLYGGQRTLLTSIFATGFAIVLGTFIGLVAGMSENWIDRIMTILMNALLAFPSLLFALMILTLLGRGLEALIIATGATQVIPFAHVTRAAVINVRWMPYVEATYACGASKTYVMLHSILPNIYPTLLTYGGVIFSYCVLNSAALSFLGLGGQPGVPDWGVMLAEGRMTFYTAPWTAIAPGLAITITIWMINDLTGYDALMNE